MEASSSDTLSKWLLAKRSSPDARSANLSEYLEELETLKKQLQDAQHQSHSHESPVSQKSSFVKQVTCVSITD